MGRRRGGASCRRVRRPTTGGRLFRRGSGLFKNIRRGAGSLILWRPRETGNTVRGAIARDRQPRSRPSPFSSPSGIPGVTCGMRLTRCDSTCKSSRCAGLRAARRTGLTVVAVISLTAMAMRGSCGRDVHTVQRCSKPPCPAGDGIQRSHEVAASRVIALRLIAQPRA